MSSHRYNRHAILTRLRGLPASKIEHAVPCAVAVDSVRENGV